MPGLWHIHRADVASRGEGRDTAEDAMAPRGQRGARLSPNPTPVTVMLRTGCQHGEEFCPPVHLIPELAATASPPARALMRRLDGSV